MNEYVATVADVDKELNEMSLKKAFNADEDEQEQEDGFVQSRGISARQLTEAELERLSKDKQLVSAFKQSRLEIDAKKNWDLFYRRNKANFFKDRYWTFREFDELNEQDEKHDNEEESEETKQTLLLEIGCGVGNFVYPLVKLNKNMYVYACDFSTDAIQLLKSNPEYDESRMRGFVCDITKEDSLKQALPVDVCVDIVTLIFVLSAIHPDKMRMAVRNIAKVLKPGGRVLVRDYGINDHSMIRFEPGHKLDENFYARQDGTRTYFFTLERINKIFTDPFEISMSGQEEDETETAATAAATVLFEKSVSEYVFRETINIKENLRVPRVFIQSKFIRN